MTSAFSIRAFLHPTQPHWFFHDHAQGLTNEPFIGNANQFLSDHACGAPTIDIRFSNSPFPDSHHLTIAESPRDYPNEGCHCTAPCQAGPQEIWLCGALALYFPTPPPNLYVTITPVPNDEPLVDLSSAPKS